MFHNTWVAGSRGGGGSVANFNCGPMERPTSTHELGSSSTKCKAGHSGSNLGSNITHLKTTLLMWHVVNEERSVWGNLVTVLTVTSHLSRQNDSTA